MGDSTLPFVLQEIEISARNTAIALLMYFMLEMAIFIRWFFTTIQCLALEQVEELGGEILKLCVQVGQPFWRTWHRCR